MRVIVISRFQGGLGDFVSLTSLIREINIKYPKKKIILFTGNKDVFIHNPRINKLFFIKSNILKSILWRIFNFLENIFPDIFYNYIYKKNKSYNSFEEEVKIKNKNIYQKILTRHWDLNLNYENLKNEIYFLDEEIEYFQRKWNFFSKEFVLIHSEGKVSYTKNKEIGYQNFQKIIDETEKINWIQIGGKNDKKLEKINLDLRGKTSLRELFYIISKSKFVVCQEGAYNHIANAFSVRAITAFTGFSPFRVYTYNNTIPIQSNKLPLCSPCMQKKECEYGMKCVDEEMLQKIIKLINKIYYKESL